MDEYDELNLNEEIGGDDWLTKYEESLAEAKQDLTKEEEEVVPESSSDVEPEYDWQKSRSLTREAFANSKAEVESASHDPAMGKATIADLMTGRLSHMSAGMTEATRHITNNQVPDYMGFDPLDILAAGERFTTTIGRDSAAWGRALPSTEGKLGGVVTRIDPVTMKPMSSFQPDVSRKDYAMALSMLTKSAEEYLVKGSGESLLGHTLIQERADKADSDFEKANKISLEIAGLYMREGTKGSEVEGARLESIQNDVIKRMVSDSGVTVLGLPNELATKGLVTTQTYKGKGQGTSLNAEEHLLKYSSYTVKNADGFQELLVGAPADVVQAYWRSRGSVKDSLFPLPKSTKAKPLTDEVQENNKKVQEIKYRKLEKDAKFARDVFRQTLTGETKGRKSRILNDRTHGEQAENSYLQDDAALIDKGHDASVVEQVYTPPIYGGSKLVTVSQSSEVVKSESTYPEYSAEDGPLAQMLMSEEEEDKSERNKKILSMQPTVDAEATRQAGSEKDGYYSATEVSTSQATRSQGSERGGMHGEKDLTESNVYVEKGQTLDQIIAEEEEEYKYKFGPVQMTEREAYLRETSTLELAEQGGDDWKKERKGNVTASMFTNTTKSFKSQDLAIALASERLGLKSFVGNSDTREGNDSEGKALRSMLAHFNSDLPKKDHKTIEEAFFVKGKEGMGASVDGRMFNADGSSSGNVELKYLASGSVEGSLKKYREQMQFQMAVNGEKQTHFGVLNKDTNQFHYELVKADAEEQEYLIEKAKEALEIQGSYTAVGIQDMRDERKRQPTKPIVKAAGQTEAFKEEEEAVEEAMTVYDPKNDPKSEKPKKKKKKAEPKKSSNADEEPNVNEEIIPIVKDTEEPVKPKEQNDANGNIASDVAILEGNSVASVQELASGNVLEEKQSIVNGNTSKVYNTYNSEQNSTNILNQNNKNGNVSETTAPASYTDGNVDSNSMPQNVVRERPELGKEASTKYSTISSTGKDRSIKSQAVKSESLALYNKNKELAKSKFDILGGDKKDQPRAAFKESKVAKEKRELDKSLNKETQDKAKLSRSINQSARPTSFDGMDVKPIDHGYAQESKDAASASVAYTKAEEGERKTALLSMAAAESKEKSDRDDVLTHAAAKAEDVKLTNSKEDDARKTALLSMTALEFKENEDRKEGLTHVAALAEDTKLSNDQENDARKMGLLNTEAVEFKANEDRKMGKLEDAALAEDVKITAKKEDEDRKMAFLHMEATEFKQGEGVEALAKEAKEASTALQTFNSALGKVGKVALELAERLLKGNEEGMGVVRLAASVGLDGDTTLGIRDELAKNGLGKQGAISVMQAAGSQAELLNNPITAAAEYSRMSIAAAATDSGLEIPDAVVTDSMNTQEYLAMANREIDEAGLDDKQRAYAMKNIFNLQGYETYSGSAEDIETATKSLEDEKLREANEAIESAGQTITDAERALGAVDPDVAAAARYGKEAAGSSTAAMVGTGVASAVGTLGAGKAIVKAKGLTGNSVGKAKDLMSKAKMPSPAATSRALAMAASGGKFLLKGLARATPVGLAALATYEAGSYAYDNFLSEDTKESISGSIDGALDSTMDFFSGEEDQMGNIKGSAFPDKEIGGISATTQEKINTLNSSVSVNVQVNPDLVTTQVDDNGFVTIDSDNYA
jgi:hypothetical protein